MECKNKPCRTGAWVRLASQPDPGVWFYTAQPETYSLANGQYEIYVGKNGELPLPAQLAS